MTPKRRLDRLERLARIFIRAGRRTRTELREKINILIDMQNQNEDRFNARFERIEELFTLNEERFARNEERFERMHQIIERLVVTQTRSEENLQSFIDALRRTDLGGSLE